MNQQQPNQNPNGYYDPATDAFVPFAAPKKKKSLTWLYILIVAALALMITKCAADYAKENGIADEPAKTEAKAAETEADSKEAAAEQETPNTANAAPEKTPEEIRAEYLASCEAVSNEEIMRRPDDYKGRALTVTGEVVQVIETSHLFKGPSISLRIRDDGGEYWLLSYEKDDVETPNGNVLEGDRLTAYGESAGTSTYKTFLGKQVTIPTVKVKYLAEPGDSEITAAAEPEAGDETVKSGTYTVAGVTMHYSRTVPNDLTGKWRIATCTSATVPETIIPEIFEAFRPEANEVFWIVNYGLKTTTRLNYFGGDIVYYSTLEYVEDEENDAKVLGGGMEYSYGQIDLTEQKP